MSEKTSILSKVNKNSAAGFTLIEVIIAVAIFALIAAPFVMSFSTSMKAVDASGEITKASFLAQMAIEEVANRSIEQLDSLASYPTEATYVPASPTASPTPTPYGIGISYKVSKSSSYAMDNGYFGQMSTPLPYEMTFEVSDASINVSSNEGASLSFENESGKEYLLVIKKGIGDSYNASIYKHAATLPTPSPQLINTVVFSNTTNDIRIKVLNNNLTRNFTFNVNIDDINQPPDDLKKAEFHIANNSDGKIQIENAGEDYFRQINLLNTYYEGRFTNAYKIEVIVRRYQYGGALLNTQSFVSYAKK